MLLQAQYKIVLECLGLPGYIVNVVNTHVVALQPHLPDWCRPRWKRCSTFWRHSDFLPVEGDDLGPFECLLRSLTPNRSVSALEGGLASLGWKGQSLHVPSPQKDALGLECGARESDQSSVSSCAKDDFNTIGVVWNHHGAWSGTKCPIV